MIVQIIVVVMIVAIIVGVIYLAIETEKSNKAKRLAALEERRDHLMTKYNDETVVNNIMDQRIFTGETAEMLTDSLGNPAGKDNQVLKTKTKEIWKYHPTGQNQYRTRITLENDVVVGWDIKDTK